MSREVLEIICRMDMEKIENQIVLQCAPLIVGLRISSLFIISKKNLKQIHGLLRESQICYYVFYLTEERAVILLYHCRRLEDYLGCTEVRDFLGERGYPRIRLGDILQEFRRRYRHYCMGTGDFPHELGLILGYPIEDVKGFIQYKGKNPLYAGYWKVYTDVPAKRELFRMFELAKEMLVEFLRNGIDIQDIISGYRWNEWA